MAKVSKKEVELLKKKRLTLGEKMQLTWSQMKEAKINYFLILSAPYPIVSVIIVF